MRRASLVTALAIAAALVAPAASAHEMRPSLLQIDEEPGGLVDVRFSVGLASGRPMPLSLSLPDACEPAGRLRRSRTKAAVIETQTLRCGAGGLRGRTVGVKGLEATGTDVVVRIETAGGQTLSRVLRPYASSWAVPAEGEGAGSSGVLGYVGIGVHHILLGPDHLLFVLGLLLLVWGRWRALLWTVTGFTVGHSVTLSLAALGLVRFPTASVEAIIALSILLVAVSLSRGESADSSAMARRPWAVAGACGLVHGLGFAGALAEVGLPQDNIPAALLLFNLGVEAGQLLFILAAVALAALLRPLAPRLAVPARAALVYVMGAVSCYWLLQRSLLVVT